MQVDALTLAALADEFERELRGARVDEVIQPTPHAIALQLWGGGRNRWLMISTHPQLARIHLTNTKPRKLSAEPPAFVMLLRKHLEGARIAAIRQPRWERVIELGFGRGAEVAEGVAATWLIVEVMGRYSNATLTDANAIILGALRPVSVEVNGYRALLPHVAYRYPPPQTRTLHGATLPRLDGADVTASMLDEAALDTLASRDAPPLAQATNEGADKPAKIAKIPKSRRETPTLAGLLAAQISGFSREVGREVAARALGAPDAPLRSDFTQEQWSQVAREIRSLAALQATHDWRPTLVYAPAALRNGRPMGAPFAFAPYQPQQYAPEMRLEAASSMNDALDAYFQDAEWQNALEGAKGDLRHILQTQRDRCLRKAEALKGELAALDEAQQLRTEADILLTYQTEIAPGSRSFTIADPFGQGETDQPPITIALDPRLTPVENANRRYARYHKLQRAGEQIPPQLEANEIELARIEQLQADLALAETPAEVSLARAEIAEAGYIRGGAEARRLAKEQRKQGGKKNKQGKGGKPGMPGGASSRAPDGGAPLRRRLAGGLIALVGKNSRQNETVTFHEAAPNDLWLHARGVPGAHVILKTGGRPAPTEALHAAAALAAYYSQARLAGSVPVDYTEQRYVRHMKGGGPGMVIYERERTLHSAPEDAGEPVK